MRRFLQALRWRVEAGALWAVMALLTHLPERAAEGFGATLGTLAYFAIPRWRQRSLENLRLIFAAWDEPRRRRFARHNLTELGRAFSTWVRFPALSPQQVESRVELSGLEHLTAALARGRGALVVTGHFGLWELIPAMLHLRAPAVELQVVGRVLQNPYLRGLAVARRRLGATAVLAPGVGPIVRALRRGAVVGLVVDQHTSPRRGGLRTPFLGQPAWTTRGPATLSLRTGAPVLPAYALRLPGGRCRIEIGPEIRCERSGSLSRDLRALTSEMNEQLGKFVLAHPEQWVWFHRRWRASSRERSGRPVAHRL